MKLPLVYGAFRARSARRSSPPFEVAVRACFFAALSLALVACSSPQFVEPAEPAAVALPLTLDCHAHSGLEVGEYVNHWADWRLTVDTAGHARATLTVVDGPSVTVDGDDPALSVTLPGDSVAFDIWSADGRGHFVQPYPGLVHGYDVAVPCE